MEPGLVVETDTVPFLAPGRIAKKGNSLMQRMQEVQQGPAGQIGRDQRKPAAPIAGNINRNGTSSAFTEDMRRRETYRFRGSPEYRRAVAACVAAYEARMKPSKLGVASYEVNPRLAVGILLVLIVLGAVLYPGCRAVSAASSLVDNYTDSLNGDLVK